MLLNFGFIGWRGDSTILLSNSLAALDWLLGFGHLNVALGSRLNFHHVQDIGFEKVGEFSDVVGFQFLPVYACIKLEVDVQKVLGAVVLVHADIFELELDLNVVIGQKRRKLDKLVPKMFNELVVDVGDPGLQFYGDVFKEQMYAFLLLKR